MLLKKKNFNSIFVRHIYVVILLPSPTPTPSLPKPSLRSDIPGPEYQKCFSAKARPGSMAL